MKRERHTTPWAQRTGPLILSALLLVGAELTCRLLLARSFVVAPLADLLRQLASVWQ